MANESTSTGDQQFLELAVVQGLLTPQQADAMTRLAADSGASLPTVCIEQGVLRPVQVDVIQGLAESDNLAPGYQVIDLLGYGGLGIVYRANQPKLDRLVALKTIPIHRIENPSVMGRFQQEALAVGRLKHPNIVAAYDYGTQGDRLYLAMELVEGTDLDALINQSGPLSASVAWALAHQTAAGLAHAAQHKLVHRDIKPGNLLLTKPPAGYPLPPGVPLLKITDFGLVQLETPDTEGSRLTLGGTSLGTPHYMAPEQVADAHVDSRADIYALGATVFHMLVGEPPFSGKTMGQVLAAKLKGDRRWVDKLPAGTHPQTLQLLQEMLAHDPQHRVGDYTKLLNRIQRVMETLSTTGNPRGEAETVANLLPSDTSLDLLLTTPSVPKPSSQRFWLASFGTLLVATALVGGFYFAGPWHRSPPIPVSQLIPSGWERALFSGTDINDWTAARGGWGPTEDDMGGRILAGKGSIVHELPAYTTSSSQSLQYFGVRLKIDLQSAHAAELHFEHQNLRDDNLPRNVVRLTPDSVTLGSKSRKQADFKPTSSPTPLTSSDPNAEASHYQELRLERHASHWRLLLNGKPIGSQPINQQQPTESIQLVVEGAPAYFADLFVFELVPR